MSLSTKPGRGVGQGAMLLGLLLLALVLMPALAVPARAQGKAFNTTPGAMFGPKQKLDKAQPLYLQGDQLIYDTKGNRVVARGNVEIFYNNNVLTADEVVYDQGANTLTAVGNAVLKDPNGNVTTGDRFTLTDDFRDGFAKSLSITTKDQTRISADSANRREGQITEYRNGRFTPCKSEGGMPPLWCISAAGIVHDEKAQTITYQDAQFEMFGYPIGYLPYFQHPDPSVKRRSGFLIPEFGNSSTLGYGVEIPYYYVLADNMDFTFHPRYWSKQGVLWQGDFRHKLANGEYVIKVQGIDQGVGASGHTDDVTDGWRGSLETRGQFSLSSWWKFGWDVTVDSDDTFRRLYKLDNNLTSDRINEVYLTGLSDRNYFSLKGYQFRSLLPDTGALAESWVHPVLDYNYIVGQPVLGGELSWKANAYGLTRNDATSTGRLENITKATTEVNWRRKLMDDIGITYTPFAQARGDIYQLENFVDPTTGRVVDQQTVGRAIAAGGVTVSYPWVANTPGSSHVIEPIGQVIVRQASVDQRRLPDEDAKSLVFDDTNLFEISKFSGYDRIETGTRANVGVQYTFQSSSGPYARILAGQSFHLTGDNAYANPGVDYDVDGKFVFNPTNGLETSRSDYVLGVYLAPTDIFRIVSQSRFNDVDFSLQREDVGATLRYGPIELGAGYTFTAANTMLGVADQQQEARGSLTLALTNHWSITGIARYDLEASTLISDSLQLKYSDECFMAAAIYTESFIDDSTRGLTPDRSIMFRFAWKYLGEYRYSTNVLDHMLTNNVQ